MVVIPTFNGYWQLKHLLESIEAHGSDGHKILVVDNGTTDIVSRSYLRDAPSQVNLDLCIEANNTGARYETGALIHAFRNYPEEEKFLLIHDGCMALSDQWLKQFDDKLTHKTGAVNWVTFRPCLFFCNPGHLEYIDLVCGGHDNVPEGGFFGSIFYTYGSILREWDAKGYFKNPPVAKFHSESWERIWPILFHLEGFKTDCIIDEFNPNAIHYGHYPHFKKCFGGRH